MVRLFRFGVSMDRKLIRNFDRLISKKGYTNRSEAIRDLIRDHLIEEEWEGDKEAIGTITIIYNHHLRNLTDKLLNFQHEHHASIISVMHVHLDEYNCLEVLVVRDKGKVIKKISDRLISIKGVKHGRLVMTSTGKHIS